MAKIYKTPTAQATRMARPKLAGPFFEFEKDPTGDLLYKFVRSSGIGKRNAMVYSSPVDDGGDLAITNYKTLRTSADGEYSLVELHLETGRTNQIRVHLASKGCPVVGDRKYGHGNESSPIDRLCLHAKVLAFIHPVTEKTVRFESPVPKEFNRVLV